MTPDTNDLDIHSEAFLHRLMRRQLRLSIACAATFLIALLGLPMLNYFAPELMATRIAGFTLSWLLLGVLFFPLVWAISFFFIKRSIALEEAEAARVQSAAPTQAAPTTSR
jgi:uncharacterized membrane protein (DUF485 family)